MSSFHVIIPARFGSTRLPGKPLQLIAGRPMIQHVYEKAIAAGASSVTVATDDQRIADVCHAFGADARMTNPDHASGTDRIAECAAVLQMPDDAIVVNLQGDEPLTPPSALRTVAQDLHNRGEAQIATLCAAIEEPEELHSPHAVKVVRDCEGFALYFSRAPIPWHRTEFEAAPGSLPTATPYYRHIGIYAYRMRFLQRYPSLPVPDSETAESLEQLRALHHGARIHTAVFEEPIPAGVDTREDLERVEQYLQSGRNH